MSSRDLKDARRIQADFVPVDIGRARGPRDREREREAERSRAHEREEREREARERDEIRRRANADIAPSQAADTTTQQRRRQAFNGTLTSGIVSSQPPTPSITPQVEQRREEPDPRQLE